jgi:hypothetical protein
MSKNHVKNMLNAVAKNFPLRKLLYVENGTWTKSMQILNRVLFKRFSEPQFVSPRKIAGLFNNERGIFPCARNKCTDTARVKGTKMLSLPPE